MFVIAEFFEDCCNDEDDDDARGDEAEGSAKRARDASGGVAYVRGHVDSERAGGGFTHGDHVGELVKGEPARALGHARQEGDRCESAADGKQADEEEFNKEFE